MRSANIVVACALALASLASCKSSPSGTGLVLTEMSPPTSLGELINAQCPPGKYLVGLSGSLRPNEWMTRVDTSCGQLSGSSFVDVTPGPSLGPGGGGGYAPGGCAAPGAVASVTVTLHVPGGNVSRLDVTCLDQNGSAAGSYATGITTSGYGATLGPLSCATTTHRAVGVRGRATADGVTSLGLMCRPKP